MIIDRRLQVSAQQALTATAASTDTVDLGHDQHNVGQGDGMFVALAVRVALAGTSPTFAFSIQCDDNAAFSSPRTLATSETFTALAAGRILVLPFPFDNERHVRINYTLGGTTPTVTVDTWITNQHPQSWRSLPDGI